MNYELAKQLKEAGFPFVDHTCAICEESMMSCGNDVLPRLSELIEACSAKPIDLYGQGDKWGAATPDGVTVEGSTPEEAVSLLWLALNPNTD